MESNSFHTKLGIQCCIGTINESALKLMKAPRNPAASRQRFLPHSSWDARLPGSRGCSTRHASSVFTRSRSLRFLALPQGQGASSWTAIRIRHGGSWSFGCDTRDPEGKQLQAVLREVVSPNELLHTSCRTILWKNIIVRTHIDFPFFRD